MDLPPPVHNTSSSSSSSEDDENAMAAAMGFSSFGTQPPTKRAKIDHVTLSSGNGSATGGNTLPLGTPKRRQEKGGGLGMEEEEDRKVSGGDVVEGEEEEEGGKEERGLGSREERDELEKRQAEVLRRINEGVVREEDTSSILSTSMNLDYGRREIMPSGEDIQAGAYDVMAEDAAQDKKQGFTKMQDGFEGYSWVEWKKGVLDERGDMVIYDKSFVEDPWGRLRGKG
ncbi:MAG: hypothetical protein Q9186_002078 [Xanthomendoza sp. 1 TL-2023]